MAYHWNYKNNGMKMDKMKIGIIGQGYVGTAVKETFKKYFHIETYDIDPNRSTTNSLDELIESVDFCFICIPTPMNIDGSCNISIIKKILSDIDKNERDKCRYYAIKSTIPPGTTIMLNEEFNSIDISFNPEFLTEANFINDFKNQDRIIIGGDREVLDKLHEIYQIIFTDAKIILTDSKTAEMVKYLSNAFLATKVSFANEFKMLCDELNINYNKVVEYSTYDKRLGNSHWKVPGPDGKLGFGGSCFPKDINALISFSDSNNIDLNVIKAAWKTNLKVRPEKDWENLIGRAVTKEN